MGSGCLSGIGWPALALDADLSPRINTLRFEVGLPFFRRVPGVRRLSDVVAVAQLVRAPGCGPGGRGFKSHQPPQPRPLAGGLPKCGCFFFNYLINRDFSCCRRIGAEVLCCRVSVQGAEYICRQDGRGSLRSWPCTLPPLPARRPRRSTKTASKLSRTMTSTARSRSGVPWRTRVTRSPNTVWASSSSAVAVRSSRISSRRRAGTGLPRGKASRRLRTTWR